METTAGAAKLQVSTAGGQGVAVVQEPGPGPIETMVGAAKLQVSRAGGQAVCVLEILCAKVQHAQRSEEVGGFLIDLVVGAC